MSGVSLGMLVVNEEGDIIDVFSLWASRKCVVAFTRHMGCMFCKEEVAMFERNRPVLENTDVCAIVITIGRYQDIPKFRAETAFAGEKILSTIRT